jgi:predicted Rossmann-fold nucleotide-binding protein
MKAICVYCGSAAGILPAYAAGARQLAANLVNNSWGWSMAAATSA